MTETLPHRTTIILCASPSELKRAMRRSMVEKNRCVRFEVGNQLSFKGGVEIFATVSNLEKTIRGQEFDAWAIFGNPPETRELNAAKGILSQALRSKRLF